VVFVAVYGAAAGHGFIKDDYAWILGSRVDDLAGIARLFTQDNGFYRPVVSLTFAFNEALFGAAPRGYGLTNVVLALIAAWTVARLALALGLPRGASWVAASIFLLNPHLRMPVLWISGRTALVLTIAAAASALALLRGRIFVAWLWLLVALFTKEEAVLLPLILAVWMRIEAGSRFPLIRYRLPASFAAALAIYAVARASTAAMMPWTAPPFYRFTFDPATLVDHVVSYADRAMSFAAIVALLAVALLGRPRPLLDPRTRRILICAAVWIAGALGLTLFVPVKSDVYACLPSAGAALAAAAVASRAWTHAAPRRRRVALAAAVVLPLAMAPLLHARTRRFVEPAQFASAILQDLNALTADLPASAVVVVHDDRSARVNLDSTFGTLFNEAFALSSGRRLALWIDPPATDAAWAGLEPPCPDCPARHLEVAAGGLRERRTRAQ
jgi:hypothetical protein